MIDIQLPFERLRSLFRHEDLTPATFDHAVTDCRTQDGELDPRLKVVFFWGENCPNCLFAQEQLALLSDELRAAPVDFFSVNAYKHMDLTTRFGLYGIPVFLFFKRGRLISRINSFPTRPEFLQAIHRSI